jgi:hypothetical protein
MINILKLIDVSFNHLFLHIILIPYYPILHYYTCKQINYGMFALISIFIPLWPRLFPLKYNEVSIEKVEHGNFFKPLLVKLQ